MLQMQRHKINSWKSINDAINTSRGKLKTYMQIVDLYMPFKTIIVL